MAIIDMKAPAVATYEEKTSSDFDDEKNSELSSLSEMTDDGQGPKEGLLAEEMRNQDIEALRPISAGKDTAATTAVEYNVSTRTKLIYLAGYFALNLLLTIYNKAVLGGVSSGLLMELFNEMKS